MRFYPYNVKKNMFWHVPVSIATLSIGIYLSLVCIFPSFAPEHHEIMMTGKIFIIAPYAIFILIGSPLFTLWYYSNLETVQESLNMSKDVNQIDMMNHMYRHLEQKK